MPSLVELLVVFLTSFGFNLIPFAGPSNLLIASNSALILGIDDPAILVVIGFLVAIGAAGAKSIHYVVTFFVGKHLSEEQRQKLDAKALKIKRWAAPLLFVAAMSPIPDEPVIVPLGLLKYSPVRFFSVFFLGKLLITVIGAFFGSWTKATFSGWLSPAMMVVLSVVLTVVITVILLKVDFGKLAVRFLQRGKPVQTTET